MAIISGQVRKVRAIDTGKYKEHEMVIIETNYYGRKEVYVPFATYDACVQYAERSLLWMNVDYDTVSGRLTVYK